MTIDAQEAERIVRTGAAALQQGRPAEARRAFETLTATGRANVQIWMLLATACRALGDVVGEEAAVDAALALDSKLIRALIMKAERRAGAGNALAGVRYYNLAIEAGAGQALPPALAADLARAETARVELSKGHLADIVAKLASQGIATSDASARFRQSIDIMVGEKQIFMQEPTAFFFPGLPHIQYFDPADFAWAAALEARTDAIRGELQALMADGIGGFRPYMHSELHGDSNANRNLIDSPDWSTLFLIENDRRDEDVIARCPTTWDAMREVPLAQVPGSMPTIMFSLLRPGARIAPHTGMFNTRLTCHLPLIVPPNCGFRVGNEARTWESGTLMIFDDTIEHEAWNGSGADRVVLIFDIWRPELTADERCAVAALLGGSGSTQG